MNKFFNSLFSSAKGSISSKRVCGFLGWIVVLFATVYATLGNQPMTDCTELIFASITLLGVDSVTEIWKNKSGGNEQ